MHNLSRPLLFGDEPVFIADYTCAVNIGNQSLWMLITDTIIDKHRKRYIVRHWVLQQKTYKYSSPHFDYFGQVCLQSSEWYFLLINWYANFAPTTFDWFHMTFLQWFLVLPHPRFVTLSVSFKHVYLPSRANGI